ncbi:MAG: chromosomal replication initiator protein DnaA [Puniceicoccales bacterium]|jgi:chromosomal replication initiator protein|nr:chromosomal replication initiator protein DnaA [Puniceicoccales bacterium]
MSQFDKSQTLWRTVQSELQKALPQREYQSWFDQITCTGSDDDCMFLVTPNDFAEIWVNKNYQELLSRQITLAAGRKMTFQLQLLPSPAGATEPLPGADGTTQDLRPASETPPPPPPPLRAAAPPTAIKGSNTFANFIVAPENELAHAAALSVANDPGKGPNPLFIYGATGLGKTHLMHAIALAVLQRSPGARILYVTSEAFTNDYINSVQEKTLPAFRRRYRETDVLLVDDIHFLADKERTQEEFFHTFNALNNYHKQIVLTSDRPAREIARLEERLVTRFNWGMTADITAPRLETRMAILQKKASVYGFEIPGAVNQYLAERIAHNVRNLEGAINRLAGFMKLGSGTRGDELTIDIVSTVLRDLILEDVKNKITAEVIQKKVAEYYRLHLADMTSKKRTSQVAFPRQMAMYLCEQLTDMTLTAIGEAFGGRDHGTVIHARRTVQGQMEVNATVKREVEYLTLQIGTQRG